MHTQRLNLLVLAFTLTFIWLNPIAGVAKTSGDRLSLVVLKLRKYGQIPSPLMSLLDGKLSTAAAHTGIPLVSQSTTSRIMRRHRRRLHKCYGTTPCKVLIGHYSGARLVANGEVLRLSENLYQVRLTVTDILTRRVVIQEEDVVFGKSSLLLDSFDQLAGKLFSGSKHAQIFSNYRRLSRRSKERVSDLKNTYGMLLKMRGFGDLPPESDVRVVDLKIAYNGVGILLIRQRRGRLMSIGGRSLHGVTRPLVLPVGRHILRFYDFRSKRVRRKAVLIKRGRIRTIRL